MTNAVRSICPFCSMGCSLRIHPGSGAPYVGESGIPSLDYDTDGPFNRGSLCGKGNMSLELLTHPQRIEAPQIRVDGCHQAVGWDDALDDVAERLDAVRAESGAAAIGIYLGPYLTDQEARSAAAFGRSLGTPNVDASGPEDQVFLGGLERSGARPASVETVEQIEAMTAMLAVGDVFSLAPCLSKAVLDARYDRHRNLFGTLSCTRNRTTWFGRPDLRCGPAREVGALALMLRVALEEGAGADLAWAERAREVLLHGELGELEVAAELPRTDVAGLVEALCAEENSGVFVGAGYGDTERADLAAGLAALLAEATGSRFLALTQGPNTLGVRRELAATGYPDARGFTAPEMLEAAVTGDLRALLVLGCDPVGALPGSFAQTAAESLDLLVTTAPLPGETTQLAHVVLPSLTFGEKAGSVTNAFGAALDLAVALPPPGVARADLEILDELTDRLAPTDAAPTAPVSVPEAQEFTDTGFFSELELYFRLERREMGGRETGSHLLLSKPTASHSGDGWLTRSLSWPSHESPRPEAVLSEGHARDLGVTTGDEVRLRSHAAEAVLVARIESNIPDAVVLAPPHEPSVRRLAKWRVDPALRNLELAPGRVSVEPVGEERND